MCTVTFLPRKRGYALAMNRDEKLTRTPGSPPTQKIFYGRTVLAPSEPGGGMWIAVNDVGATFALVNWYLITARVKGRSVSRGNVVKAASTAATTDATAVTLTGLPLNQINPFRLIGVFPENKEIVEWRWDLRKLVHQTHTWKPQQWISSGFDEPAAQRMRGKTFRQALDQTTAGSLDWLRRLHHSHSPHSGPFSTCMHRSDAATVSYTEIQVSLRQAKLRHHAGAPCQNSELSVHSLEWQNNHEHATSSVALR